MTISEASACWLQPEWRVQCENGSSPRLLPKPWLLFIMVIEAPSQEFRIGCPREKLYADDLVIISELLEKLQGKLRNWSSESLTWKEMNFGSTWPKPGSWYLGYASEVQQRPLSPVSHRCRHKFDHLSGLMQERRNSIANARELHLSWTNPSICEGCSSWVHKRCRRISWHSDARSHL